MQAQTLKNDEMLSQKPVPDEVKRSLNIKSGKQRGKQSMGTTQTNYTTGERVATHMGRRAKATTNRPYTAVMEAPYRPQTGAVPKAQPHASSLAFLAQNDRAASAAVLQGDEARYEEFI
jgi:hypothetical protein